LLEALQLLWSPFSALYAYFTDYDVIYVYNVQVKGCKLISLVLAQSFILVVLHT